MTDEIPGAKFSHPHWLYTGITKWKIHPSFPSLVSQWESSPSQLLLKEQFKVLKSFFVLLYTTVHLIKPQTQGPVT